MSDAAATEQEGQELGLWDCINIIVGIVVGASIFEVPWLIMANVPNAWMGLLVWLFGGLLAFFGGLVYAELATTYPRSGGDYEYLSRGFRPWVGFLFGWAQLAVILPASIGVMAYVFALYAKEIYTLPDLTGFDLTTEFQYACLAVIVLSLLNILGVKLGKTAQNVLTIAKIVGIGGIIVTGFLVADTSNTNWDFPEYADQWGWQALAIILVLYAYGGWNDAAFVAAEVRDRKRNIPWALMLGIGGITLIYLLVNLAYLLGLGFDTAQQPSRLPAELMQLKWGETGATAISILVMVSALGALNGLCFTGSRVYATLGADHKLFGWLGHWKPGRGAPVMALSLQALITIGMIILFGTDEGRQLINEGLAGIENGINAAIAALGRFFGRDLPEMDMDVGTAWQGRGAFEALVAHSAPAFWLFFLLTGFSLFRLRDQNPHISRPFSVPLYPLIPMIFCAMCAYMLYRSIIYIEWRSLFAIVLLVAGLPLFWLSCLLGKPRTWERN